MAIKIIFKDENIQFKSGIYKITFRERFYIGCSTFFDGRKRSHQSQINKFLANSDLPWLGSYCNIIDHLKKYPQITEGVMELLEECDRWDNIKLFAREKEWIWKLSQDGMCLNLGSCHYFTAEEAAILNAQYNEWYAKTFPNILRGSNSTV